MNNLKSIQNATYPVLDFNIPTILNAISPASDVLNRAPDILAFLHEERARREELVGDCHAAIIIGNPGKKQDEKKALIQQDARAKALRQELVKIDAMLRRWEQAEKSASKFYGNFYKT